MFAVLEPEGARLCQEPCHQLKFRQCDDACGYDRYDHMHSYYLALFFCTVTEEQLHKQIGRKRKGKKTVQQHIFVKESRTFSYILQSLFLFC